MEQLLAPLHLPDYVPQILRQVDRVTATWEDGQTVDMLMECPRIALLIIVDTLFSVDYWDELPRLWNPILKTIQDISPGAWIVFPNIPRPGYRNYINTLDRYLYRTIEHGEAPSRSMIC
jgi:cytochrome P450